MGKTPSVKRKLLSKHSRAAKREASPSLNVDKSLLNLPRPVSPTANNPKGQTYHVLAPQTNGISKKKKNKKESRNQRLRREKGLQRAEANLDILAVKREKSKGKERLVKERSRAWDEVDSRVKTEKPKKKGAVETDAERMDEDEWEDEVEDVRQKGIPPLSKTEVSRPVTESVDEDVVDADVDEIT